MPQQLLSLSACRLPGQQLPPRGHHQHSLADSDSLSSPGQPPTIAQLEHCRMPSCLRPPGVRLLSLPPLKFNDGIRPHRYTGSIFYPQLSPRPSISLLFDEKTPLEGKEAMFSQTFPEVGAPLPANADIPCTGQRDSASKLGKGAGSRGFLLTHSERLSQPPTACHFASSL